MSRVALCTFAVLLMAGVGAAQEEYPRPLVHTASDHPAEHLILLSVDGLHAVDLARWVGLHPEGALAQLSRRGVTYTNAHVPWADPAAGLLALVTGGTPISTGVVGLEPADRSAEPAHALLRVNTIFEVVEAKGWRTAWAGESAETTDLLRGPSGHGLDEACGWDGTEAAAGVESARTADGGRERILLHWIDGRDCAGQQAAPVPVLMGASFEGLRAAEDDPAMGYVGLAGRPSAGLLASLRELDGSIARLISELQRQHLYDSTWIVVTAPYGGSPMNHQPRRLVATRALITAAQPGAVTRVRGGDAALIWLARAADEAAVVKAYEARAHELGIRRIVPSDELALTMNAPARDPRMPALVLEAEPGVLWVAKGDRAGRERAWMAHDGLDEEDTHVALLVAGAQLPGRVDKTPVPTTQLPALLLRALGMEKFDLEALHREHSPALPGVF